MAVAAAFLARVKGMDILTDRLMGLGVYPAPVFLDWGTGTTTATAADIDLVTPAAPTATTRVTGTASSVTTTYTKDTAQVTGTITAGGALTIEEVGLFTTAAGTTNDMFLRATHGAVVLATNDSIAYTIKWQIT